MHEEHNKYKLCYLIKLLINTASHYVTQFEHDIQHLLHNMQVTRGNNVISANLNGVFSFWSNVGDLSHGTRWQCNVMLNQAVLKYSLHPPIKVPVENILISIPQNDNYG